MAAPDADSIAGVAARLALWGSRAPKGLARVEFDSDFSRRDVDARVRDACAAADLPFHAIELPQWTPAAEVVSFLLDKLAPLPHGLVSITGWATAFPADVPLLNSLRVLNYNRENLAQFPLCQIWWMTRPFTDIVIREIPDLASWFIVRLHLGENIVSQDDEMTSPVVPVISQEEQDAARRQSADLKSRFRRALQNQERLSVLLSPARSAVLLLFHAGLKKEATDAAELLLNEMIDAMQTREPYRDFDRAAFNQPETWMSILSLPGFNTPVEVGDAALLFDIAGHKAEAENFYQAAYNVVAEETGHGSPFTHVALQALTSLYNEQGRYNESETLYRHALSGMVAIAAPNSTTLANLLTDLGGVLWRQGKYSDAEEVLHRALGVERKIAALVPSSLKRTLTELSIMYRQLGRAVEADMYTAQAESLRVKYAQKHG